MKNTLSNFHTHTTFCDGKDTPETVVLAAIDKGFTELGFSGHGYTPYDSRYCMKDTGSYIAEIKRLKREYRGKINIFLGTEEDAFSPVDRARYDYVIGSCHYYRIGNEYLPIDSGIDYFNKCLDAFGHDLVRMAEVYYSEFTSYLKNRRPDIIGHFDLITKYDELAEPYFLGTPEYTKIAEKYTLVALGCGSIFEVNTGAISRGYRSNPYPAENLLHILKKNDAKIILSADSHRADTIDYYFNEARRYLYDIGFRTAYTLSDNGFLEYPLL